MKKIVSFCLWGNKNIFCKGAIENAKLVKIIYPEWIGRFYVADNVKKEVVDEILNVGCEVYIIHWTKYTNGTFWRFLPLMDNDVSHFISRDVDSRIGRREARAVNAWLESGKACHIIRDSVSHCDFMMAGLFGLDCVKFKQLMKEKNMNISIDFSDSSFRFADQNFLLQQVAPIIFDSHIAHDRCKNFNTGNEVDFPLLEGEYFCGICCDENNKPIYAFDKASIEASDYLISFEHKDLTFTKEVMIMQHFKILYNNWEIRYVNDKIDDYMKVILRSLEIDYLERSVFREGNRNEFSKFFPLMEPRIKVFVVNPEYIYNENLDLNKLVKRYGDTAITCFNDPATCFIINNIQIKNEAIKKTVQIDINYLYKFKTVNCPTMDINIFFMNYFSENLIPIKVIKEEEKQNEKYEKNETLKDKTISAVIVSRNDEYILDYKERCKICFDSMIQTFDEVIYVDWNSPGISLLDRLKNDFKNDEKLEKIKQIIIDKQTVEKMKLDNAEECCQVLARNIGIKQATCDYIVSTNIDIIAPNREDINKIKIYPDTFYTIARVDVDCKLIYDTYKENKKLKLTIDIDFINEFNKMLENAKLEKEKKNCYLINARVINCGDFQFASRDIWKKIKGFEEGMIKSFGSDTNVQLKVLKNGYNFIVLPEPTVFHMSHGARSSHIMAKKNMGNDFDKYIFNFKGTENTENWGGY